MEIISELEEESIQQIGRLVCNCVCDCPPILQAINEQTGYSYYKAGPE